MMKTKRILIETREDEDVVDTESDEDNVETEDEGEHEISDNEDDSHSIEDNSGSEESLRKEDNSANTAWADSIAKILRTSKPKGKKTVVLSKSKKISDIKSTKLKDVGFEIESKDGQVKRENVEESDDERDKPFKKKKKDLPMLRVKPDILNKDRERLLSKIATKGVVQLFNAVKKQQKDIDSKLKNAGSLEVKRDKILQDIDKREFLNVLMGSKLTGRSEVKREKKPVLKNETDDKGPTWKVLRDDFMMSANMKDWDKQFDDVVDMKGESRDST